MITSFMIHTVFFCRVEFGQRSNHDMVSIYASRTCSWRRAPTCHVCASRRWEPKKPLKDFIFRDPDILNDGWLIIGRQVATDSGRTSTCLRLTELVVDSCRAPQTTKRLGKSSLDSPLS